MVASSEQLTVGKGGAYDLTAHYSLLMRRNDRAESPMRLCTTPLVLNEGNMP